MHFSSPLQAKPCCIILPRDVIDASLSSNKQLYTVGQKCANFGKCRPMLIIISTVAFMNELWRSSDLKRLQPLKYVASMEFDDNTVRPLRLPNIDMSKSRQLRNV